MKAKDLDRKFDANEEDVLDAFDLSRATRPNAGQKRTAESPDAKSNRLLTA